MMRHIATFIVIGAAALTWPLPAAADGSELEGLLGESVVTTASKSIETEGDAPATVSVITGDSMRRYGARSLGEAMNMLGLGVITTQGPDSGNIGARGVMIARSSGEHFLLLVNGQRMNDLIHGAATFDRTSGLPIDIIDHVEIVLGPGSVLYGSNAMLGVINVVTRDAKNFSGAHVAVESDLFTSIRPWAGVGTPFKLFGIDGEAAFELEYYKQWGPSLYFEPVYGGVDPATGKPTRYTTGGVGTGIWGGASSTMASQRESTTLLGRARLGKFELSLQGLASQVPVSTAADFDSDPRVYNHDLAANLTYENQLTPVVTLKGRLYTNMTQASTFFTFSRGPQCPELSGTCSVQHREEGQIRGVELTPRFDWLKDSTFVTTVGAMGEWRAGRSIVDDFNVATGLPATVSSGYYDQSNVAGAAYLQQTWHPVWWLGVNAGGRLDYDPRFSPVASPRLALHTETWQGGTLKVIYSQAFRAPNFAESYFAYPTSPVSQGLRPEHEQSIEGSIEQRFNTHRVLFGAFATHWTDLIQYYQFTPAEARAWLQEGKAVLPPESQYRNLSSVQNWGFNAAFSGTQAEGKLEYGLNLTAAVARLENGAATTPLEVGPELFGNAHVAYTLPQGLPTLALALTAQGMRYVDGAFESGFRPIPAMGPQAVARATVSGPVPDVAGLTYRVTGFYSTTDREPLTAGPLVNPSANNTSPALYPIDRARVTVGLQYDF